ncbi:hypothetical protein Tco_1203479 [Tanacetum coccineum]
MVVETRKRKASGSSSKSPSIELEKSLEAEQQLLRSAKRQIANLWSPIFTSVLPCLCMFILKICQLTGYTTPLHSLAPCSQASYITQTQNGEEEEEEDDEDEGDPDNLFDTLTRSCQIGLVHSFTGISKFLETGLRANCFAYIN